MILEAKLSSKSAKVGAVIAFSLSKRMFFETANV